MLRGGEGGASLFSSFHDFALFTISILCLTMKTSLFQYNTRQVKILKHYYSNLNLLRTVFINERSTSKELYHSIHYINKRFATQPALISRFIRRKSLVYSLTIDELAFLSHWTLNLHRDFFQIDPCLRFYVLLTLFKTYEYDEDGCFILARRKDGTTRRRPRYHRAALKELFNHLQHHLDDPNHSKSLKFLGSWLLNGSIRKLYAYLLNRHIGLTTTYHIEDLPVYADCYHTKNGYWAKYTKPELQQTAELSHILASCSELECCLKSPHTANSALISDRAIHLFFAKTLDDKYTLELVLELVRTDECLKIFYVQGRDEYRDITRDFVKNAPKTLSEHVLKERIHLSDGTDFHLFHKACKKTIISFLYGINIPRKPVDELVIKGLLQNYAKLYLDTVQTTFFRALDKLEIDYTLDWVQVNDAYDMHTSFHFRLHLHSWTLKRKRLFIPSLISDVYFNLSEIDQLQFVTSSPSYTKYHFLHLERIHKSLVFPNLTGSIIAPILKKGFIRLPKEMTQGFCLDLRNYQPVLNKMELPFMPSQIKSLHGIESYEYSRNNIILNTDALFLLDDKAIPANLELWVSKELSLLDLSAFSLKGSFSLQGHVGENVHLQLPLLVHSNVTIQVPAKKMKTIKFHHLQRNFRGTLKLSHLQEIQEIAFPSDSFSGTFFSPVLKTIARLCLSKAFTADIYLNALETMDLFVSAEHLGTDFLNFPALASCKQIVFRPNFDGQISMPLLQRIEYLKLPKNMDNYSRIAFHDTCQVKSIANKLTKRSLFSIIPNRIASN